MNCIYCNQTLTPKLDNFINYLCYNHKYTVQFRYTHHEYTLIMFDPIINNIKYQVRIAPFHCTHKLFISDCGYKYFITPKTLIYISPETADNFIFNSTLL